MRQMTTLWSLLLTLLVAVTTSTAQEPIALSAIHSDATTTLRAGEALSGFGYADRYVDDKDIAYVGVGEVNLYLSGYILLPDVGANKITKISFPAAKADKQGYLLVLSADGKKTLYQQAYSIVKGSNEATLKTPFITEAGKQYLVGFATKAVGGGQNDPFVIPFDGGAEVAEATYVAAGKKPYPTDGSTNADFAFLRIKGLGFGSACIFVTLEDEQPLQDMGYLVGVSGTFEMVKPGAKVPVTVSLRNIGMNEITSIEITYQFGTGETKVIPHTLATALTTGKTGECKVEVPAEGDGMGTVHFAVTKVNGKASPYADRLTDLPFKIGDFEAINRETVILERFTSEKCGNCPGADPAVKALIDKMTESGLRVSYIMYHSGYLTDFLTMPESEKLLVYFFPSQGTFAPAMSVNRSVIPPTGGYSECLVQHAGGYNPTEWTKRMKSDRQGVKIERIDQTITDDKLKVVVSGVALKGSFNPEDIYLTVIVTEDNIASRFQGGAPKSYKHQAVPRLFLTDALGDKITPAADGTFSLTLEGTLKEEWKRGDCKVVAIAHPGITNQDRKHRAVHTAETAPLGFGLSNEAVAPHEVPVVTAEGGYLSILGQVDAFELYDMSGALVTTSVGTRLEPGVYAIRIFSNLRVYTYKVMVR